MQYVTLAAGVPKVSRVCLGTWQFSDPTGTYAKQTAEVQCKIVKTAFENGINFFDTAEGYGNGESERALGVALKQSGKKRSEYFIARKVNDSNLEPAKIEEAITRTLKNLDTEYLDLYQVHWPNHDVPIKDTMATLKKLQDQGKIKAIGVSNFGVLDTRDAAGTGVTIASNQLIYNLVTRTIEGPIMEENKKNNIGILAYSPLGQGLLTGKYETLEDAIKNPGLCRSRHFDKSRSPMCRHDESGCEKELFECIAKLKEVAAKIGKSMSQVALAWVLAQDNVISVIAGASRPEHVVANCAAISITLDKETLAQLNASSEAVKKALGDNPDLWNKTTRYR